MWKLVVTLIFWLWCWSYAYFQTWQLHYWMCGYASASWYLELSPHLDSETTGINCLTGEGKTSGHFCYILMHCIHSICGNGVSVLIRYETFDCSIVIWKQSQVCIMSGSHWFASFCQTGLIHCSFSLKHVVFSSRANTLLSLLYPASA
jgi:hypothetical protein